MTSPASVSKPRCLAIACRVIGRRAARSVAVAGPPDASAARMLRRLGSASAAKTSSATASGSRAGIEVFDELTQLALPPLNVAAVRAGVKVVGQLREAGLDHGQPGPLGHRLKSELDIGTARIVARQTADAPGVAEHARRLETLDAQVGAVAALKGQLREAAHAQVDGRLVAEPGAQSLSRRDRFPHLRRRVGDADAALDPIGKAHDTPPYMATRRLRQVRQCERAGGNNAAGNRSRSVSIFHTGAPRSASRRGWLPAPISTCTHSSPSASSARTGTRAPLGSLCPVSVGSVDRWFTAGLWCRDCWPPCSHWLIRTRGPSVTVAVL